jgi:hypothetical protein
MRFSEEKIVVKECLGADPDSTKNLRIRIQSVKISVSDPDSIRSVDSDTDSESRSDPGGQK